ncbi:MAG: anion transporter [Candidatus Hydrogenedens sp.]|nr:anion transporter [Candidatus Hydrogenedens sp.]
MTAAVAVFALVYAGMVLGRIPWLAIDRTGIALLGALALIALREVTPEAAWASVDVPTISLLFGLMIVSAQFRLGGFYTEVSRRAGAADASPPALLGLVMACAGALSALLTNDIVCLAMTPPLIDACARRRLNPVPFLLGLACAANIGSAATLIGNPQNMLIGEALDLSFARYTLEAAPAVAGTMAVAWIILCRLYRTAWQADSPAGYSEPVPFDRLQTMKALTALGIVLLAFVFSPWPRDVVALGMAGLLLLSRRMHSRETLGLVDWHLLVLFIGLFVVNAAFEASGAMDALFGVLRDSGVDLSRPYVLFAVAAMLSNIVSNVPAVMLLLPASDYSGAGAVLALSSTLAGNLIIVGSIANIIVVEQARARGIVISWREHARAGVPITLATLALAATWLALLHAAR